MDKGSSFIMLGIILMVVLPFLISSIVKKNKLSKLKREFMKFAQEHKVNLSQHEVIHNKYAIGIDTETKKIAYLNINNKNSGSILNLPDFTKCKVNISDRNAENAPINLIEIVFSPRDSKQAEKRIEMYNYPAFSPRAEDINVVHKWADIISSNL